MLDIQILLTCHHTKWCMDETTLYKWVTGFPAQQSLLLQIISIDIMRQMHMTYRMHCIIFADVLHDL